jgi:hypothetical protein
MSMAGSDCSLAGEAIQERSRETLARLTCESAFAFSRSRSSRREGVADSVRAIGVVAPVDVKKLACSRKRVLLSRSYVRLAETHVRKTRVFLERLIAVVADLLEAVETVLRR